MLQHFVIHTGQSPFKARDYTLYSFLTQMKLNHPDLAEDLLKANFETHQPKLQMSASNVLENLNRQVNHLGLEITNQDKCGNLLRVDTTTQSVCLNILARMMAIKTFQVPQNTARGVSFGYFLATYASRMIEGTTLDQGFSRYVGDFCESETTETDVITNEFRQSLYCLANDIQNTHNFEISDAQHYHLPDSFTFQDQFKPKEACSGPNNVSECWNLLKTFNQKKIQLENRLQLHEKFALD